MNIQKKWYGFFALMVIMWGALLNTPSVSGVIGIAVLSVISFFLVRYLEKVIAWAESESKFSDLDEEQPAGAVAYEPDMRQQQLQIFRRRLAAKVREFNMPPPVWVEETTWRKRRRLFVPCWWQFESLTHSVADQLDVCVVLCWSDGKELTWYPADPFRGRRLVHSERAFPITRRIRMEWKEENGISERELARFLKSYFNI